MPRSDRCLRYLEAIKAAYAAGARTIVVDSMSHELKGRAACWRCTNRKCSALAARKPQLPSGKGDEAERRADDQQFFRSAGFVATKRQGRPARQQAAEGIADRAGLHYRSPAKEFVFEMT